jgi:hypothetical protein
MIRKPLDKESTVGFNFKDWANPVRGAPKMAHRKINMGYNRIIVFILIPILK